MIRPSLIFAAVLIVASTANAQRPGERPRRPPGGFPMPPGFHLMAALDADKDGKVSAKEIENAVAALKKLDADKDGKLSPKEIGWPPSFGGGPGRGFGGSQGGGRPRRPDPDAEESPQTNDRSSTNAAKRNTFFTVPQLKRLDRNDDGKITKEEIPKRMQEFILSRVDANENGIVELEELEKLADRKSDEKN